MESISEYEVRCPRCNVSFPVGTRKCFHCGGRTGPSAIGKGLRASSNAAPSVHEVEPGEIVWHPDATPIDPYAEVASDDDAPTTRASRARSLMTVLWVVLAIGFSLIRACSENG